jgi:hypothetical protein
MGLFNNFAKFLPLGQGKVKLLHLLRRMSDRALSRRIEVQFINGPFRLECFPPGRFGTDGDSGAELRMRVHAVQVGVFHPDEAGVEDLELHGGVDK